MEESRPAEDNTPVEENRSPQERVADTRHRLAREIDAWFGTGSAGRAWVVPYTFAYVDDVIVAATMRSGRTVANLTASPKITVHLDGVRDVVSIDGTAEFIEVADLTENEHRELTRKLDGADPHRWADIALRVHLDVVRAWRNETEITTKVIMRGGRWLA